MLQSYALHLIYLHLFTVINGQNWLLLAVTFCVMKMFSFFLLCVKAHLTKMLSLT